MCEHVSSVGVVYLSPNKPTQDVVDVRHYCTECGLVHELDGKPIEFFTNRLDDLCTIIRDRGRRLGVAPLAQVEKRLIIKRMMSEPVFADIYGTSYHIQRKMFINIILERRKMPEAVIEEVLY